MKKRFSALALVIACALTIIITCFGAGLYFFLNFGGTSGFAAALKFASIYHLMENYYVGEADLEAATEAAFRAFVSTAGDRWSFYMSASEFEAYMAHRTNSFRGIGVTIIDDETSGLFLVVDVVEESPAETAGIKVGDLLYAIDGESLKGKTSAEIRGIIQDKTGEFEITLRCGNELERTVRLKAGPIFRNPVSYEMFEDNIGYVRIRNFSGGSAEGIVNAVESLIEDGARAIVIDVRNNGGGLLDELVTALDFLLPAGDLFVSRDRNGNETVLTSGPNYVDIPLVVLINENSHSAAEFFAAALSEYERAILVGTRTEGKARTQVNMRLPDGSAVHLSRTTYLTPNRVDLTETGGLTPDIEIVISDEERAYLLMGLLEREADAQILAALYFLRS